MKHPLFRRKNYSFLFIFLPLSAILFVSCQGQREITKPAIITSIPNTVETELSTTKPIIEIKTETSTLIPTKIPLPTRIEVTDTSTPSPTESLAPLATLSLGDRYREVLDLLKNNRGCRLPCWWGFTPGETRWDEAQLFLSRLGKISMPEDQNNKPFLYIEVHIPVPKEISISPLAQTYTVENYGNGIIQRLEIYPGNIESYSLANILMDYGMPGEVWIRTFSAVPSKEVPFVVILFYSKLGFLVEYNTSSLRMNPIRGCPEHATYPFLYLWSPLIPLTFDEIAKDRANFGYGEENKFRRLEDATNLNPGLFYDIFKDPKNTQCLETPMKLWK